MTKVGTIVGDRKCLGAIALAAAGLGMAMTSAFAIDDSQYPDFRGSWARPGAAQWDTTKPPGLKQQAPLTAQFQKVFEANMAETAVGGQDYNPQVHCLPSGMPRLMIAYEPLEMIVTPEVTYVRADQFGENRRIYTDGRNWPDKIVPSFDGYSIGRWVDRDASGRYHTLEVETRGFKGPRTLDASGLPLHPDNKTILKERFYLDPANPNRLHDQITTIDNAYTRPWTVIRDFDREEKPIWTETNCASGNHYVFLKKVASSPSSHGRVIGSDSYEGTAFRLPLPASGGEVENAAALWQTEQPFRFRRIRQKPGLAGNDI